MTLVIFSRVSYASFPANEIVVTDNKSILDPGFIDYLQEMLPILLILTPIIYIIVRLIQRKPLKKWEKLILYLIGGILLFFIFMIVLLSVNGFSLGYSS